MRSFASGRRFRRILLVTGGCTLLLVVAGATYQSCSVSRERTAFPPPGQFVDVGERRLHFVCLGSGEPTVVFEAAMFGSALSASVARKAISARTRVCSYDRMGTGWSDPGPAVIPIGMLADDLERLLEGASIPPPHVFVAASIGGLTAELYARRHPDRVAGLVFLDAATSAGLRQIAARSGVWSSMAGTFAACMSKVAARLGVLRLVDPLGLRGRNDRQGVALLYRAEPMSTVCGMVRGLPATLQEFGEVPPLSVDGPLVVLSAETTNNLAPLGLDPASIGLGSLAGSIAADRLSAAREFARGSTNGTWRLVPGSDHLIASSQPQAVVDAVTDILSRLRGGDRQSSGQ